MCRLIQTDVLLKDFFSALHCARHSFAVNVLNRGANIKTVSSLLGHTSLKMTERYLHVVDSLKQDAIDSLGEIKFSAVGS